MTRAFVLAAGVALTVAGLSAAPQEPDRAARQRPQPRPSVVPGRHDTSRALRAIPPHAPRPKRFPHPPLPLRAVRPDAPSAGRTTPRQLDAALQTSSPLVAAPATIFNFEGVNNVDGVLPPDTNGDIGPNHYVQWVNLTFAVYNRSGALLYGPAAGSTIWDGFGGPCEFQNDGDPIVLYDHLADRWLLSQFSLPNNFFGFLLAPFYQCVAISQTGDPTGAYHRYEFAFQKLNDYPKFGVWPDAYYMTINQFSEINLQFAGQGVAAFDRAAMLAGQPARMVYFDLASVDPNLGGMLPADLDGPPPPAGSPNYFVQMDDDSAGYPIDRLQLWRFHVDWTTPSQSTFTGPSFLPVAAFDSNLCNYARNCIPQPGTPQRLDAIADRLMYRLQYRNFGSHESLVVNHTVDVDGADHAGVRWYEIRDPNGAPVIHQQGTFAPDGLHRWMASAAMDAAGNLAIAYNAGGAGLAPSIRYAARVASDALGVLGLGENDLIAGSGSQTHTAARWGDYSMLGVDPVDGCTFWATAEYMAVTSTAGWQTRIGAFRIPGCGDFGAPPDSPGGLTAAAVSSRRIDLAWIDQSSDETAFSIERCPGAGCTSFIAVGQTPSGTPAFSDTALEPATTYRYRVRAFNGGGTSTYTNIAEAATLAPPAVTVVATAPTATEAGLTSGTFTVTRSSETDGALPVSFVLGGTAVKGTDYQNVATTVTIPNGSASAVVTIAPIDDTTIEQPETVVLTLSTGVGYTLGSPATATVTIVSDDQSIDLVVTALTAPAVAASGGTAQVTDTTRNQGTNTAGASATSFYLSANFILDAADVSLGSRPVGELAPGASSAVTTPLVIPASTAPGTYVLFAKADGPQQVAETSEANNTRPATLRVGPDLAVSTLTSPATVAAGTPFTVTEATKNQGAGTAAASVTRFYLSANVAVDANDTALQTRVVPALDTNGISSTAVSLTIPAGTAPGGYYLIANADDGVAVAEHTETNNTRYVFVNVGGDLVMTSLVAPLKVASGATITVSDTTKNNGADATSASVTAFFLSSNFALDASDTRLHARAVPALAAGASSVAASAVTLPAVAVGTWYLMAAADDEKTVAETSETNNTRYATLQVGPDLTMSALTVPTTAVVGSTISITDSVRNTGGDTAGESAVRFYLSVNTVFDASDTLLEQTRAVPSLAPNVTHTGTTMVTLPAGVSGKFNIIAVADGVAVVVEWSETNNALFRAIVIN